MALDFPDSPNPGEVWTDPNGKAWEWDGVMWTGRGAGSGVEEAPTDGQRYMRQDADWSAADPPDISTEDQLTGLMKLAVVDVLPGTPDADTIYFVTG